MALYLPDAHSVTASSLVEQSGVPFLTSALGLLETTNAIRLRTFRGERTSRQESDSVEALNRDIDAGVFSLHPVPHAAWDLSRRLSGNYSATLGTRSLDILQVAIALSLKAEIFLTFDRRQAELARRLGLLTPLNQ